MNAMDAARQPGIQIDQIFVSRVDFEHGELAFEAPLGAKMPEIQISVTYEVKAPPGDRNKAVAVLRVSSAQAEKYFYRLVVEVMAAVSVVPGQENMPIEQYVQGPLVSTLFPFVREAVASISGRGRHGPVYLKPFNIRKMFPKQPGADSSSPAGSEP